MQRLCKKAAEIGLDLFSEGKVYHQLLNLYDCVQEAKNSAPE